MSSYIRDYLTKEVPINITPQLARQLTLIVMQFEIRDEHPLTLNSQMFGVNKFIFSSADRQMFFDIIGLNEQDVVDVIKKIPSINKDFKVVSDAFNVMVVYLVHLLLGAKLSANMKHDAIIATLNYFQYRLIGSAVNHYFPHGASYEIMQSVIESLSLKFSVRQLGSWRNVVVDRSESIAFDTRAHHGTLQKFDNDKDILYLISDTSTRIRSQLKIITGEYYVVREANTFITSHSSTGSLDGEKVLRERSSSFETMSVAVFDKVLVKQAFLDENLIRMVQKSVPRLNVGIIRRMIAAISDEAKYQMETDTSGKVIKKRDNTEIYVGIEELISHTVHVVYSSAVLNSRVNLNSKISIFTNTRNVFSAARSSNPELLNVKLSVADLLKRTRISTREATVSGLIIAYALYVTLLSFKSL